VLLLGTGALVAMAHRLLPVGTLGFRYVRWLELRRLLRYGLMVQTSQAIGEAGLHTDRIFIALCVGPGAVAFYDVGNRFVQGLRSLALVFTSAVMPVASELAATEGVSAVQRFYLRGLKYHFLVTVPLFGFAVVAAPAVIGAWVGREYAPAVVALQLLGIGYFVNVLTAMGTKICRGMGRPELETQYTTMLFVLSVALNLLGAQTLGYVGVLIATLASLVTSSAYFFVRFHHLIRLPTLRLLGEVCAVPVAVGTLAGLCAWGVSVVARRFLPITGRVGELALLAVEGLLFMSVYAVGTAKGGYLGTADRQIGRRLCRSLMREWWDRGGPQHRRTG